VASGSGGQIFGFVFIGAAPNHRIGRSVTGEVDINGNGGPDIIIGANLEAWIIPGDGPKTQSGSTKLTTSPTLTPTGLIRSVGTHDALQQFGATVFTPGADGNVGELAVASAGDLNGDGIGDLILGAGDADIPGKVDAGKAYIIFGSRDFPSGEILLSDVGGSFPGVVIQGAEAGDQLGASVSGGFDVTGDGVADVLVGSPFPDSLPAAPEDSGETYIISFRAPGEVVELTASQPVSSPGAIFLEWSVANRAVKYNVYRGQLSTLAAAGVVRTSNMVQLACGIATDSDSDTLPDTEDALAPAAGQAFFYLVTGWNLIGEGPLGAGTPARIPDAQCP